VIDLPLLMTLRRATRGEFYDSDAILVLLYTSGNDRSSKGKGGAYTREQSSQTFTNLNYWLVVSGKRAVFSFLASPMFHTWPDLSGNVSRAPVFGAAQMTLPATVIPSSFCAHPFRQTGERK